MTIIQTKYEKERGKKDASQMKYTIVQLGDVSSHAHENSLGGQLKGPEPNFLEPPFPGLIIHDISGKRIIGLERLSAMIRYCKT